MNAVIPLASSGCWPAQVLTRGLSSMADNVIVRLDKNGIDLRLTDRGVANSRLRSAVKRQAERIAAEPSVVTSVAWRDDAAEKQPWTDLLLQPDEWSVFEIRFSSGMVDQVAMRLHPGGTAHVPDVLQALWPLLRDDCLRELSGLRSSETEALLWTISRRLGAAVLVLDGRGRVLESNAAGSKLLEDGRLLRESPEGLEIVGDGGAVRRAVAKCLAEPHLDAETVLVLDDPEAPGTLPLFLARFGGAGGEARVVAMLPRPPDPRRVERLAQMMGLTPAEARVAALMQLGRPNREAASMAGLKEQTFNTYAKRVLAKLNLGCRAEVAQMLTWQAGGGSML